jgi:hypothetical protein
MSLLVRLIHVVLIVTWLPVRLLLWAMAAALEAANALLGLGDDCG